MKKELFMGKYWKYLTVGVAVGGFLIIFAFTKAPVEVVKIVFSVGKTVKEITLKEKPSSVSKYDVITSASVHVDNTFSQEKS